ncbi:MAG: hypothetical protein MRJ67_04005 [Nitrospirales bacterium]|nr:hypothetical protein [Nitrospirales bacterium]MDR4482664.1 hypothetical protein [Nitrospirales bacterium]
MNFDPAIAAMHALQQAEEQGELGHLESDILEAETLFSADQGPQAKRAFDTLQELGAQLPQARHLQEFLIYITWQQVTEGPLPRYFQLGLDLCDRFLDRFGSQMEGTPSHQHVLAIRESFQGGLGIEEEEDLMPEHDEDAFLGGD